MSRGRLPNIEHYVPPPSKVTVDVKDTDPNEFRFSVLAGEVCEVTVHTRQWSTSVKLTVEAVDELARQLAVWKAQRAAAAE